MALNQNKIPIESTLYYPRDNSGMTVFTGWSESSEAIPQRLSIVFYSGNESTQTVRVPWKVVGGLHEQPKKIMRYTAQAILDHTNPIFSV